MELKDNNTSPITELKKKQCIEKINALSFWEVSNLSKLLDNPKARAYIGNNIKFSMMMSFLK